MINMLGNNENTKLTLESHGRKFSAEMNWDCDCEGLLDAFLGLSVAATYPYKTMLKVMHDWSKEQLEVYFPEEVIED